jgi:peptidoglycan DL-endopeptidase CwlO
VTLGALVEHVGGVLGRAHSLFGGPASTCLDSGAGLAGTSRVLGAGQAQMSGLRGVLPTAYGVFADDAGPVLDDAAAADSALSGQLGAAKAHDSEGFSASGAVVSGASSDAAALASMSGTPGGQRALIAALRARVVEQRQVVQAYRVRDARIAQLLRSLEYRRTDGVGGGMMPPSMPFSGAGAGGVPGLPGGGSALGGVGGPGAVMLAATSGPGWESAGDIAGDPGRGAAMAALSKRGRPYVWGAKGPDSFDCSGLVQWAWGRAGVALGGNTWAQINEGVPVAPGQVRAGDLIFPLDCFGEGGVPGPGHVQLAISATEVVHAPQQGDVVRVAPMPARFIARRPLRGPV